jgi:iron complex outermembrane receptor protein
MNKMCLSVAALLFAATIYGQYTLQVKVLDAVSKKPLSYASVSPKGVPHGVTADSTGLAQVSVPSGKNTIAISHIGYESQIVEVTIPIDTMLVVELMISEEEEEEVIILSTRSTRTIRDIPTRVELVAGEELDEKANMKPGDIRMVLNESTGITTQQTSAISANAAIRIQGLDGRYTQVLRDGFPLYAGFSSGLGLLQTPPLDLKQFEVIKGSSSTLYGGGAIAGLVNLISKTPDEEGELKFHFDITSAGGLNSSGFYGKKFKKTGLTLFASRNSNPAYDPSDVGFTAIPKFERYSVNPKFFWYIKEKTTLMIGGQVMNENRVGGDIDFIKGKKPSGYSERNNTDRFVSQVLMEHRFNENKRVTFKNSINYYRRNINLVNYAFIGRQLGTYSEASFYQRRENSEWIAGLNLLTDHFEEQKLSTIALRNYTQTTAGAFVQNSMKITELFRMETGLRGDYIVDYGLALLPRISLLFKFTSSLSSRIGGGMGYKTPNIFTEESERLLFRNVYPVDEYANRLEKSYGVNADINYKTRWADGRLSFSINHLFFYTRIHDPLLLRETGGNYFFTNVQGHFDSKGMETNVKLGFGDLKLFTGYTFTKAYLHEGSQKTENYLTPRHRLNNVLLYEAEEKWKVGLEAYYFSKQKLSDGRTGKSYWIMGLMGEKIWEQISLYINFENFTDTRQTRFDSIYTGTFDNPFFRDIYAPLDGFVVNGGVKLRL